MIKNLSNLPWAGSCIHLFQSLKISMISIRIIFYCSTPYSKSSIDQACPVKMAGYCPPAFCVFMNRTWPLPATLTSSLVNLFSIIWLARWAGNMEQSCLLETTREKNSPKFHQTFCGQDGWILASFFFVTLWNSTGSINTKKRTWPIFSSY